MEFFLLLFFWYDGNQKRRGMAMKINARCKYIVEPPNSDLDFSKFLGGLKAVEESEFQYFLYGILNRNCWDETFSVWTTLEAHQEMDVASISFLDLSQEKVQKDLENILTDLGYGFVDILMFIEGDAVVIEKADGQKEYMGLYNTHHNYAAFIQWKDRQEFILNGETID